MTGGPTICGWEIGDIATWFGAIGSIAAAVAAVKAARTALAVARLPIDADNLARLDRARVIAAAISDEMYVASTNASVLAQEIEDHIGRQRYELLQRIPAIKIRRTAMISRFLGDLDVFGRDHGAVIAGAAADVLNLNAQLEVVGDWKFDTTNVASFSDVEKAQLSKVAEMADVAAKSAGVARDMLKAYTET